MTLKARPIDPRDVNAVVDAPTFRVYFWSSPPAHACREFEVTGADVDEVMAWADGNREPDETYELGVLTKVSGPQGGEVLLTRIKGTDPTRSAGDGGTSAVALG